MNTQTHILMGALLFGRKMPRTAWAGAAGGIAPDVPMLAIVAVLLAGLGVHDGGAEDAIGAGHGQHLHHAMGEVQVLAP